MLACYGRTLFVGRMMLRLRNVVSAPSTPSARNCLTLWQPSSALDSTGRPRQFGLDAFYHASDDRLSTLGVKGAFLCTFIWFIVGTLKLRNRLARFRLMDNLLTDHRGSDELIIPATKLTVRYILDLLNA